MRWATEAKKADPEGHVVMCHGEMTIPDGVKVFVVLHEGGGTWQSMFLPMRIHACSTQRARRSILEKSALRRVPEPRGQGSTRAQTWDCVRDPHETENVRSKCCVYGVCTQDRDQDMSECILSAWKLLRCESSMILCVAFRAMQHA